MSGKTVSKEISVYAIPFGDWKWRVLLRLSRQPLAIENHPTRPLSFSSFRSIKKEIP